MNYSLFLCGPPGSGKTTYALKYLPKPFIRLSLDDIILSEAKAKKSTYDKVFDSYVEEASSILEERIKVCNEKKISHYIDMTNCTIRSRVAKLNKISNDFFKIAISFPPLNSTVLIQRVSSRAKKDELNHTVPFRVIQSMNNLYTIPKNNEGFDLCVQSDQFLNILKGFEFK